MVLLGFAYITIKENVRKWSFYGVIIVYLASLIFSRLLMEFALQDLTKFFIDLSFSFLFFFLILSTLFITTDIMNKDLEKKSIYIILSKGISRNTYIIGRAFSLFIFTLLVSILLGLVFLVVAVGLNEFITEHYRKSIHVIPSLLVLAVLWLKAFLLSTVVLFFSSFMVTPFLIFLSSVVVYIAGSSIENLYYFVSFNEDKVGHAVKTIVSFLFYLLPSFSSPGPDVILGLENLNLHKEVLDISKTLIYSLMMVVFAMLFMHKRELT